MRNRLAIAAIAVVAIAGLVGGAYLVTHREVGVLATATPPVNILFLRDDYGNRDVRMSHPWWPPMGSMRPWPWSEVHLGEDTFDFSAIDAYVARAAEQRVELYTGRVVTKPVMLQLEIYDSAYRDYTPALVYQKMGRTGGYTLDPGGGCAPVTMPPYDDPAWQEEYDRAVQALADRYRDDPTVVGYWIAAGVDGETTPVKNVGGCDYQTEAAKVLTCDEYKAFVKRAIDVAAAAWAPKPVWVQAAPAPCAFAGGGPADRKEIVQYASARGVGYKMNGLTPDQQDAYGAGSWAQAMKYDVIQVITSTVAFEFAHNPGGAGITQYPADPQRGGGTWYGYWAVLNALSHGAQFISLNYRWGVPLWGDAVDAVPLPGFAELVAKSLSWSTSSPIAWIAFHAPEGDPYTCPSGTCGSTFIPGDFALGLIRDTATYTPTQYIRADGAQMPLLARAQPYARHALGTTAGNPYIGIAVDTNWAYYDQLPLNAGGSAQYLVTVWFLDVGTDGFQFEYLGADQVMRSRVVNKLGSGRWREVRFALSDMRVINNLPGGVAFRLYDNEDGMDYFHMVIVEPLMEPCDEHDPNSPCYNGYPGTAPTATPTPTPTSVPPTPTPTNTPTVGPGTPTPIPAPQPTPPDYGTIQDHLVLNEIGLVADQNWYGSPAIDAGDSFIELYNPTDEDIPLVGMRLCVDRSCYKFPRYSFIRAKGWKVVFAAETGLYLSPDPGSNEVYLLDRNGAELSRRTWRVPVCGRSIGAWPDGSDYWVEYRWATPGRTNAWFWQSPTPTQTPIDWCPTPGPTWTPTPTTVATVAFPPGYYPGTPTPSTPTPGIGDIDIVRATETPRAAATALSIQPDPWGTPVAEALLGWDLGPLRNMNYVGRSLLRFTVADVGNPPVEVCFYQMRRDTWTDIGATWRYANALAATPTPWATPGAMPGQDYYTSPRVCTTITATGTYTIDITSLIRPYVASPTLQGGHSIMGRTP